MRRFVCEQNISHFEHLIAATSEEQTLQTLRILLASYKRELALIRSEKEGAISEALQKLPIGPLAIHQLFSPNFRQSPHPCMIIDPRPGLRIVDVNPAYEAATFINGEDVVGKPLFEIFPDNDADPTADGVSNLFASLKTVAETGKPHAMAVQRYDIRDAEGRFLERHWQPINSPLFDPNGSLVFLLHHVEDVTQAVTGRN